MERKKEGGSGFVTADCQLKEEGKLGKKKERLILKALLI